MRPFEAELSIGGGGAPSDYVEHRLPNIGHLVSPSQPTALTSLDIDGDSFIANWGRTRDAVTYLLDVSTLANFGSFVSGYEALSVDGLTQLVTGLSLSTTYYYRVRAVNPFGSGQNSDTVTTVTLDALMIHDSAGTEIQDSAGTPIESTEA